MDGDKAQDVLGAAEDKTTGSGHLRSKCEEVIVRLIPFSRQQFPTTKQKCRDALLRYGSEAWMPTPATLARGANHQQSRVSAPEIGDDVSENSGMNFHQQ